MSSHSPMATESKYLLASSGMAEAWGPPMMQGMPSCRHWGQLIRPGSPAGIARHPDEVEFAPADLIVTDIEAERLVDDGRLVRLGTELGKHMQAELRDLAADGVIALT